jgi:hypothetical protein
MASFVALSAANIFASRCNAWSAVLQTTGWEDSICVDIVSLGDPIGGTQKTCQACWTIGKQLGQSGYLNGSVFGFGAGCDEPCTLLSALPVTTRESKNKALQLVLERLSRDKVQPAGF